MAEYKNIEIQFQGLNKKVDSKLVKPPQLTELKNVTFDNVGAITKRGGLYSNAAAGYHINEDVTDRYGSYELFDTAKYFVKHGNGLAVQDGNSFLKVLGDPSNTSANSFHYLKSSRRVPFSVRTEEYANRNGSQYVYDYDENSDGTWAIVVWLERNGNGGAATYETWLHAIDLRSKTEGWRRRLYSAASEVAIPRVNYCSGSDEFIVTWNVLTASTGTLYSIDIDADDANMRDGISFANVGLSPVTVKTGFGGTTGGFGSYATEYCPRSGTLMALGLDNSSGDAIILSINQSTGSLTGSLVITSAISLTTKDFSLSHYDTGFTDMVVGCWSDEVSSIEAFTLDASSSPLSLTTSLTTISISSGIVDQVACTWSSSGEISFFATVFTAGATSGLEYSVYTKATSGTLTGGTATRLVNGGIAAGAYTTDRNGTNPRNWIIVYDVEASLQPAHYVYVGSEDVNGDMEYFLEGRIAAGSGVGPFAYVPSIKEVSSGVLKYTGIKQTRIPAQDPNNKTARSSFFSERDGFVGVLDTTNTEISHSVKVGENTYSPGGFLSKYNGETLEECGFMLYPDKYDIVAGAAGGNSYAYRIYYQHIDARGESDISTFNGSFLDESAADPNTNPTQISVKNLPYTRKNQNGNVASIFAYRTVDGPTDDSYYHMVNDQDPATVGATNNEYVPNLPENYESSFQDNRSDAQVEVRGYDYQSAGEVDHICPPSPVVIGFARNRLWLAGGDIAKNTVWYSKKKQPGRVCQFSDVFTRVIDESDSEIKAIAELNQNVIIFKEDRIFLLPGDGPTLAGTGDFEDPVEINSDVGAVSQRTIHKIPQGLLFVSDRGIHLLAQDLTVQDVGVPVEPLITASTYVSVTRVPGKPEVVFWSADGNTLLFNYEQNLWCEWDSADNFTDFTAIVDAKTVGDTMYALQSDGTVNVYTADSTDDAHQFYVATPWITLETQQSYYRIKTIEILGEIDRLSDLSIIAQYNYDPTDTETVTYDTSATVGADTKQIRVKLRRQKAESIRFVIQDTAGEPEMRLNSMLIRATVKSKEFPVNSTQDAG